MAPDARRQDPKPRFYVVQFIELPYDCIDNYVCVPHTWVKTSAAVHPKAQVAYPNYEAPLRTRNRVKGKEKKGHKWRYYAAIVKYESDIYDDAELWIVQRNNFGPSQKRKLKDMSSSSALSKENKPELEISMKRPAMSASTGQHDNKRSKPETVVRTIGIQTDSNPASCLQQHFCHQHPGLQNSAAQQHCLDMPSAAQGLNGSHATDQTKQLVNETFLQPQRTPAAKQPSTYPSRFDRSENQDNVQQVPRVSVGTNYDDDCPPIKLSIVSARDLQANASTILQYISILAQQLPMQTNHQDSQQQPCYSSNVATGRNTIKRSTAVQCSMSYDVVTGSNTKDRSMAAQCSMSPSKIQLADRDVAAGNNTTDRPMAAQCSMSANKTPLTRRDVATGSNTISSPMVAENVSTLTDLQMHEIVLKLKMFDTMIATHICSSMSPSKIQLADRDVAAGNNTTDRPMAAQCSMSANKTPITRRDVATGSNTISSPMVAENVSTSTDLQMHEIVLKLEMLDTEIATHIMFDKRMESYLHYTSTLYDNFRTARNKMSEQLQRLLEYRNHLESIKATYPADTGSGAT